VLITEILGALVVGLVACQLGLFFFSSFKRLIYEQQKRSLDRDGPSVGQSRGLLDPAKHNLRLLALLSNWC
jgi:hypothetical protein